MNRHYKVVSSPQVSLAAIHSRWFLGSWMNFAFLFSARGTVLFFFFFCTVEKRFAKTQGKGTCKKKRWRYDETIIHGHVQMQLLLKSGVLKRRKNNKNKTFDKKIGDVWFEIILNNLKNIFLLKFKKWNNWKLEI